MGREGGAVEPLVPLASMEAREVKVLGRDLKGLMEALGGR